jgi:hypothetical protein
MEKKQETNIYIKDKCIGFKSVGRFFLQHCPECNLENYAMAVASGRCLVWVVDRIRRDRLRKSQLLVERQDHSHRFSLTKLQNCFLRNRSHHAYKRKLAKGDN